MIIERVLVMSVTKTVKIFLKKAKIKTIRSIQRHRSTFEILQIQALINILIDKTFPDF
jgi:hypothetical protein